MTPKRVAHMLLLVGVAVVTRAAFAVPAHAQTTERLEVEVVGGGPVFDLSDIYPGATLHSLVHITNVGDEAGHLSVEAANLVDESRCSDAEVRAGMACGSGRGHLGDQMTFSIDLVPTSGDPVPVWSGRIDELQDVELDSPLAPATTSDYRFSAHLPASSGNETQSDLLGFDLRFGLEAEGPEALGGPASRGESPGSGRTGLETDSTEVLGLSTGRAQPARLFGITLPRTGAELARWGFAGGGALLVGSALTLASRGRARFLR